MDFGWLSDGKCRLMCLRACPGVDMMESLRAHSLYGHLTFSHCLLIALLRCLPLLVAVFAAAVTSVLMSLRADISWLGRWLAWLVLARLAVVRLRTRLTTELASRATGIFDVLYACCC